MASYGIAELIWEWLNKAIVQVLFAGWRGVLAHLSWWRIRVCIFPVLVNGLSFYHRSTLYRPFVSIDRKLRTDRGSSRRWCRQRPVYLPHWAWCQSIGTHYYRREVSRIRNEQQWKHNSRVHVFLNTGAGWQQANTFIDDFSVFTLLWLFTVLLVNWNLLKRLLTLAVHYAYIHAMASTKSMLWTILVWVCVPHFAQWMIQL